MAKEKVVLPESVSESAKKVVPTPKKGSSSASSANVGHLGQGDVLQSRATFPMTTGTPRKAKSKFTLPGTSSSIPNSPYKHRMPAKSQSIPELRAVKASQLRFIPPRPVKPVRKSLIRVPIKPKPRKSVTMLELRSNKTVLKPNTIDQLNYAQILETLGYEDHPTDTLDVKYRYLAYKTYCFMMKNAWKRAKDDRQAALERVAKLQTSVLKTKTQLHVIKSLYHIERRHFDTASVQLHELKHKLASIEVTNDGLTQNLKLKESSLQQISHHNEKLRNNLDEIIAKTNRMEIQLDKKRDEFSQVKSDNDFLIKQRQEMEASMTNRLNRYKDALNDTTDALFEANKELDQLQPLVEEFEIKKLELDEYRFINSLQVQEIDMLTTQLQKIKDSLTMKHRLKLVWDCLSYKKERNWYLSVIFGTFLPSLQAHDLVAVEP